MNQVCTVYEKGMGSDKGSRLYADPEVRAKIKKLEKQQDHWHIREINKLVEPTHLEATKEIERQILSGEVGMIDKPTAISILFHSKMDAKKRAAGLITY